MDRVLIIDDDRELCALVQRTLVAAGVDADEIRRTLAAGDGTQTSSGGSLRR